MYKFKVVKKGYDIQEVESYLSNRERVDKDALADKSIRVEELKNEVSRLKEEIGAYKKREENINLALVTAIEKAKDIECQAKLRYALECERIKLFRGKWTSYADSQIVGYKLDEDKVKFASQLKDMEDELASMMRTKIGLDTAKVKPTVSAPEEQYLEESKRLLDKVRAKANAKSNSQVLSSQFNLDDIHNPPELSVLCKELGLMA